ncbi:MAG: hypothetical protein ACI8QF_003648 [Limisphaerales bacterium]|jgi:hypothetical protein
MRGGVGPWPGVTRLAGCCEPAAMAPAHVDRRVPSSLRDADKGSRGLSAPPGLGSIRLWDALVFSDRRTTGVDDSSSGGLSRGKGGSRVRGNRAPEQRSEARPARRQVLEQRQELPLGLLERERSRQPQQEHRLSFCRSSAAGGGEELRARARSAASGASSGRSEGRAEAGVVKDAVEHVPTGTHRRRLFGNAVGIAFHRVPLCICRY